MQTALSSAMAESRGIATLLVSTLLGRRIVLRQNASAPWNLTAPRPYRKWANRLYFVGAGPFAILCAQRVLSRKGDFFCVEQKAFVCG